MTKDEAKVALLKELDSSWITSSFARDVIKDTKIPKESKKSIASNLLILRRLAYSLLDSMENENG